MKPEHGPDMAFSRSTRFGDAAGANPEELIGAALAGCFSMALSASLERAGMKPEHIETTAKVHLDLTDGGYEIRQIDLTTKARAQNADEEKLRLIAENAKRECPIGKLLGAPIMLETKLAA